MTETKEIDRKRESVISHDIDDLNSRQSQRSRRLSRIISKFTTTAGNYSIQYNYQVISVVMMFLSVEACTLTTTQCQNGIQQYWVQSSAAAAVFGGSVVGQLTMGYAGDILGVNIAMIITQIIAVIFEILSAFLPSGNPNQIYVTLIVCRFFVGIGLGGIYPLGATMASFGNLYELFPKNPTKVARAFMWQIPGSVSPWIVAMIIVSFPYNSDTMWRVLLGIGAIPGIAVLLCAMFEWLFLEPYLPSPIEGGGPEGAIEESPTPPNLGCKLIGTGRYKYIYCTSTNNKSRWWLVFE